MRSCRLVLLLFILCFLLLLLFPFIAYFTASYLPADFLSAQLNGHMSAYLGAEATLIGAFISLIPIFLLIKQIRIQQNQNDADMFLRACAALRSSCSELEMWGALVSLKELPEGRNRNIGTYEGLSLYRSQVLIVIETLIRGRFLEKNTENYKVCFYILKESLLYKYLNEDKCTREKRNNIRRILKLFLYEFNNQKNTELLKKIKKIAEKIISEGKWRGGDCQTAALFKELESRCRAGGKD